MTPDPNGATSIPFIVPHDEQVMRADVSTDLAPVRPLPPHLADGLESMTASIVDAQTQSDAAIESVVAPIESALRAQKVAIDGAIALTIGQIDNGLRAAAGPVYRAMDKLTDDTFRSLVFAQESLRAEGVDMPRTIDETRADLEDVTGERVFARLVGDPGVLTPVPAPPIMPANPHEALCDTFAPAGSTFAPQPDATHRKATGRDPTTGETFDLYVPRTAEGGIYALDCYNASAPRRETNVHDSTPSLPHPVPREPTPTAHDCGCPPPTVTVTCPPVVYVPAPATPYSPACPPCAEATDGGTPTPRDLPPTPSPAPTPRAPGAEGKWTTDNLLWSQSDVCERAGRFVDELDREKPAPKFREDAGHDGVHSRLREIWDWGTSNVEWVFSGFDESTRSVTLGEANKQTALSTYAISQAWSLVTETAGPGVPHKGTALTIGALLAAVDRAETVSGFPLGYLFQSDKYLYQWANPQFIPTQSELNAAYLGDSIDKDRWSCLTRAHGNLPSMHEWGLDNGQTRPNVSENVALLQREHITRERFDVRLRQLGVTNPTHKDEYIKLAQYVPTVADIVPMMVRDVFDLDAVKDGDLDKDFELKFYGTGGKENPGPAAKWAKANGVEPDIFKLFWRMHWQLPSPTQLYEILHRLRAGRPEIEAWKEARLLVGPDPDAQDAFLKANPKPIVVTRDDVRRALELNDIAPAWIEALMSVSYNPMTRTDALNAFHANVMTADELFERLQDSGLDAPTAKRVVELQTTMRARRASNVSGVWTIRKIAQAYKKGSLTGVKADALLVPLMPDAQMRQDILRGTDDERESDWRASRIKRVRRAQLTGNEDAEWARLQLKAFGLVDSVIEQMVLTWDEEKKGRYKEITAKQISEGLIARIITADQALMRLSNLGYSNHDAQFLVRCALEKAGDKIESQYRQTRADIKAAFADARAAKRALDKELTDRDKELEAMMRTLEKERDRIKNERETRAQV